MCNRPIQHSPLPTNIPTALFLLIPLFSPCPKLLGPPPPTTCFSCQRRDGVISHSAISFLVVADDDNIPSVLVIRNVPRCDYDSLTSHRIFCLRAELGRLCGRSLIVYDYGKEDVTVALCSRCVYISQQTEERGKQLFHGTAGFTGKISNLSCSQDLSKIVSRRKSKVRLIHPRRSTLNVPLNLR